MTANPVLQQLVRELPWGKNLVIFTKAKGRDARESYLRQAAVRPSKEAK